MPFIPRLEEHATYREVTDTFAGYNHNAKIADGEFFDTRNLTSQYYPLMSNRKKRGYIKDLYDPGGILDKVHLAYVDEGILYLNDQATALQGLMPGEKQMVPFGAYIVIFPDNKYYNTADPDDYGDMNVIFPTEAMRAANTQHPELGKIVIRNKGLHPGADRHFLEHPPETDDTYYAYITFVRDHDGDVSEDEFKAALEQFQAVGSVAVPPGLVNAEMSTGGGCDSNLNLEWFFRNKAAIVGVYYNDYYEQFLDDRDAAFAAMPAQITETVPSTGNGNETANYSPLIGDVIVDYNGTASGKDYYLPPDAQAYCQEHGAGYMRILYVSVNGTQMTTGWSFNGAIGKVGFTTAPGAGTNNVRIVYEGGELQAGILVSVPKKTLNEYNNNIELQSADVPAMDYVIECKNRLWGCRYGTEGTEMINEIYACELGNFKNWAKFEGISTDPYVASVGSDGPWTGAINYLGYPTFFKEDRIHRVAVSAIGAHEITETVCDGVQPGSSKSLAVVNGILYYKSNANVVIYQGGIAPTPISAALGDIHYSDAVAGTIGDNYYISMCDEHGTWTLFCFDSKRGIWIREDDMAVRQFAAVGEELYALTRGKSLWALKGTTGTPEDHVDWYGESGVMYYQYPDKKYTNRYNFRLQMDRGTRLRFMIEYDSSGRWEKQGEIISENLRTVTIPVRPRRCDHLRLRIEGRGNCKIYSVARILTIGSDY